MEDTMWSSLPLPPSCLPYATAIIDRQPQLHQIRLTSAMPSGVFQGRARRSCSTSSSTHASLEAQTRESREARKYVVRNGSACRSLHCCFREHELLCKSVIGTLNIACSRALALACARDCARAALVLVLMLSLW